MDYLGRAAQPSLSQTPGGTPFNIGSRAPLPVPDLVGLGWVPRLCISNEFLDVAEAAGSGSIL